MSKANLQEGMSREVRRSHFALDEEEEEEIFEESDGGGMDVNKQMNLHHFQQLRQIFDEADEDGGGSLDLEEFREAFGTILGEGLTMDQMTMMFMKIDANSDGSVDWDEFCTYMVLEKQAEFEMMEEADSNVFEVEGRFTLSTREQGTHKDMIKTMLYVPKEKKYLTCSKDGMFCWWSENLQLARMFEAPKVKNSSGFSPAWITDCAYLNGLNKLAVSTDNREVTIYDTTMKQQALLHIKPFDNNPMCLAFGQHVLQSNHQENPVKQDLLLVGDDAGYVNFIQLSDLDFQDKSPDLNMKPSQFGKRFIKRKVHSDWVQKVMYVSDMKAFISCSQGSKNSLVIGDVDRKQNRGINIHKGVSCFDYSKKPNFLVTGGMDKLVRIWNPYILSKPAAVLVGHNTSIVDIIANEKDSQIISLSTDKVIKIWDMRMQKCLQTIQDKVKHRPEDCLTTMFFDRDRNRLLTASGMIDVWPMHKATAVTLTTPKSHSKALCKALYNSNFHQVVSGCEDSVIKVWDIQNGEKTFQYSGVHENVEITAMNFDNSGRRLITGSRNGDILLWNFNNGAVLKKLVKDDNLEVTDVLYIEQGANNYIAACGWNRKIVIFMEGEDENFELEVVRSLPNDTLVNNTSLSSTPKWLAEQCKGHSDDILSMSYCPPNLLASCSCDGEIIIWNIESGFRKLNMKEPNIESKTFQRRSVEKVLFLYPEFAEDEEIHPKSKVVPPLVSCHGDGAVRFWDSSEGTLLHEVSVCDENEVPSALCTDPDLCYLFVADTKGNLYIYDIDNFKIGLHSKYKEMVKFETSWRAHMECIVSIAYTKRFDLILSASTDSSIRVWNRNGDFLGILGQEMKWDLEEQFPGHIPLDIKKWMDKEEDVKREVEAEEERIRQIKQEEKRRKEDLYMQVMQKWTESTVNKEKISMFLGNSVEEEEKEKDDEFLEKKSRLVKAITRKAISKWKNYQRPVELCEKNPVHWDNGTGKPSKTFFFEKQKDRLSSKHHTHIDPSKVRADNIFQSMPVYDLRKVETPTHPSESDKDWIGTNLLKSKKTTNPSAVTGLLAVTAIKGLATSNRKKKPAK